jgi:hypothetical protein
MCITQSNWKNISTLAHTQRPLGQCNYLFWNKRAEVPVYRPVQGYQSSFLFAEVPGSIFNRRTGYANWNSLPLCSVARGKLKMVKVKFALEHAMKAQRGSRGKVLLFPPLGLHGRVTPGKRLVTHCVGGWVGTRVILDGCGNSCCYRITGKLRYSTSK